MEMSKEYRTSLRNFKRHSNNCFKKTGKFVKRVNEEYLSKFAMYLSTEMDEMWSFYHDKSHQIWG